MGISTYLAVLAGAYARAGGEEAADRRAAAGHHNGSVLMDIEDSWSAREERV